MDLPNSDLPEALPKWLCNDCGQTHRELLTAPSPFDSEYTLSACPDCKSLDIVGACQVGDCAKPASGGYPRGYGFRYIHTCWRHRPDQ